MEQAMTIENKVYNLSSPAYQKAFVQYLRRGTVFDFEIKEDAPAQATQYIWHTQGDDKVRESHAANDGGIFSYDNPPSTGNPGEDFGCRCWAEPFVNERTELKNALADALIEYYKNGFEAFKKKLAEHKASNNLVWREVHFVEHYYNGNAQPVSLEDAKHLEKIKAVAAEKIYPRFDNQIRKKVAQLSDGAFIEPFTNVYDFGSVSFVHGSSTVSGIFYGNVHTENGKKTYSGRADYYFYDIFEDPLSLIELTTKVPFVNTEDIPTGLTDIMNFKGTPYVIKEKWSEQISGEVEN